jgi:hypothetical protein
MYSLRNTLLPITVFVFLRDAIEVARTSNLKDYYVVDESSNEICWDVNDDILLHLSA